MKKLINIINSKAGRYILLFIYILLFSISTKQIFWVGKEAVLVQLESILLLPFVYAYSIIIIFFIVFTYQKKGSIFLKTFGTLCVLGIMVSQIKLIEKGGFEIFTLPISLALIDIIRNSDAFNKQLTMLIITFLMLFVASLIAKLFGISKKQWYIYAGLYYLYLAYKEYTSIKNNSKVLE